MGAIIPDPVERLAHDLRDLDRDPARGQRARRRRPAWRPRRAATTRRTRRRTGSRPAASSAPTSPASTSPAPAVASHGTPVVVTRTRPSGAATSVWWPLSSDHAAPAAGRVAGVLERRGLDRRPRSTPSIAASSPACGVSTQPGSRLADVAQRVGVDDDGHAVRARLGEHRRGVVAAAGADDPGLHPAGADDLGVRGADGVGDALGTDVADHPDQPGVGAGDREERGARVGARPGAHADDAAGVLLRVDARAAAAARVRRRAGAPRRAGAQLAGRGRGRPGGGRRWRPRRGRRGGRPCGCRR